MENGEKEGVFEEEYELQNWIGEGASCAVHIGVNKTTNEEVAVKLISSSVLKANPGLLREVKILENLSHPNIVKLIATHQNESNLYIVMELICGMPLFDAILEENPFTEEKAKNMIEKLMDAVAYLHKHKITHRDLKPENIIFSSLESDAEPKLLDFGASISEGERGEGESDEEEDLEFVGTLGYKPPELVQKDREKCGTKIDCWSMGVIAYIILCGFPPFFSDESDKEDEEYLMNAPFWLFFNATTDSLRRQITKGDYTFPERFFKSVAPEAIDFVKKLLTVDPSKRMSASQALRHEWLCPPPPQQQQQPRRSRLMTKDVMAMQEEVAKKFLVVPTPNASHRNTLSRRESQLLLDSGRSSLRVAQRKWTGTLTSTVSFAMPGGVDDFARMSQKVAQEEELALLEEEKIAAKTAASSSSSSPSPHSPPKNSPRRLNPAQRKKRETMVFSKNDRESVMFVLPSQLRQRNRQKRQGQIYQASPSSSPSFSSSSSHSPVRAGPAYSPRKRATPSPPSSSPRTPLASSGGPPPVVLRKPSPSSSTSPRPQVKLSPRSQQRSPQIQVSSSPSSPTPSQQQQQQQKQQQARQGEIRKSMSQQPVAAKISFFNQK